MTGYASISIRHRAAFRTAFAGFVLAGLFALATAGTAGEPGGSFDAGNSLYEKGKFREAADEYAKIIQSGHASAPVYFNLGNAFFKAGQIGRAILAYRYAKALDARDPDIVANLQFARNQVLPPTLPQTASGRWLGKLTLNEWTLASAAAVWLSFLLLMLPQWRPALRLTLRGWTITCGVVAALLCACLGAQYYRLNVQPTAVVVAPEAPLHQAPLADSPSPVTLHDGAEVRILDRKDNWLQVSTDPRRIGWVQSNQAILVKAE